MTPIILLRVAAILAAIQGLAHIGLFTTAKPQNGAEEVAVIDAMKTHRFFSGGTRSYWDMYFGYGLIAAGVCLVEAVLLWQLIPVTRANPALARPIIGLLVAANLGHLALVARYFMFPVPMVFDVLIAALLTWSLVVS